ncbi:MAG: hypothetical protein R2849_22895 [Thermomicrobiales bacterium]
MMATAAGVYIAERGQDPRHFSLIATGGLARRMPSKSLASSGSRRLSSLPSAGVASAGGLLVAPPRLDLARSLLMPLEELDWAAIDRLFATMETGAIETLGRDGRQPRTDFHQQERRRPLCEPGTRDFGAHPGRDRR